MNLDILHYWKGIWSDLRKHMLNSCSKSKWNLMAILESSSVMAVQSFQMNLLYFLRSASLSHVPSNYVLSGWAHHIQSSLLTHQNSLKCTPCVHKMSSFIRLAHRSGTIQKSRMVPEQRCQLTLQHNWIPSSNPRLRMINKIEQITNFQALSHF